ncbi:AS/PAC sensor signal transduction histidine kinase [Halalkaliarchaeum desulfuricum]|uniref:AS/PAC sensor signal transduction histidine kinase n=1 Tax=Halalkaliarchaeum desulfuricum TaxID=2055893 RepID=A0A343TIW0_9EURY|nr:PAS domain S-box protein [Halalkaliarchaeum desulfuricum]AUX09032.1 AS/PAC sensor signal transduction histidine kinase [Halalkaliarchaeum desulfuricum]
MTHTPSAGSQDLDRFRRAVEQSASAVFFTDTDGTIQYVNPAFEELTGYDADEAVGRNPRILKSGQLSEEYYERMWGTILDGAVWREEVPNRRSDGGIYYANQTIAPIENGTGEVSGFVAIQNEITEYKRLSSDLDVYETIIQQLEDPVMLQDLDGNFVVVNEAVSDYTGLSTAELIGRDESAFMDEESAAFIADRKRAVLETEAPISYEVTPSFSRTDERRSFSTLRYPYYDADGSLSGTVAICRDFTDLKNREAQLAQYKSAVEGAYDLIAACDADERLLFANGPYCTFHGIDPDSVDGLTLRDVLGEQTYEIAGDRIEQVFGGDSVRYRMQRTHAEQGDRILDIRYYPIGNDGIADIEGSGDASDDSDSVRGSVAIMRDVTDEAEREQHLKVVDRILRHNIRNELNVVHGRAEQIREETDGEIADAADGILAPVERLLETAGKSRAVTEILRKRSDREPVDVAAGCRTAAKWLGKRHPNAHVDVVAPESALAIASPNFGEAIDELLENAVEHAESEAPSVEVRVTEAAESIHVSIGDQNPAISEMDRAILEEGRPPNQLSHGSGLGLWLVYWIVTRSGGSLTVRAVEPQGNLVTIELSRGE